MSFRYIFATTLCCVTVLLSLLALSPGNVFAYHASFDADTLYVDEDATGSEDGSSWENAYTNLQDALAVAESNDHIWIADGIYYPDEGESVTDGDVSASFTITGFQDGVELYGGFDGTENSLSERTLGSGPATILSGDIDQDDAPFNPFLDSDDDPSTPSQSDHINGSNSFNIVFFDGTVGNIGDDISLNTEISDLAITGGVTGSSAQNKVGSGAYCDGQRLRSCGVKYIRIIFYGIEGSVVYENGKDDGNAESHIINCLFFGNNGESIRTTSINRGNIRTKVFSSTFVKNYAPSGSVMYNSDSFGDNNSYMYNSLIWGNNSIDGKDIVNGDDAGITMSHVIIENGMNAVSGNANASVVIDADPLFVDVNDPDGDDNIFGTDDDGYRINAGSPAVDSGDNDRVPTSFDLAGAPRQQDVTGVPPDGEFPIDIGAYEATGNPLPVELTTFTARQESEDVLLTWQTASEQNNTGFEVQRRIKEMWEALSFVEGAGTTVEAQTYRFRDAQPPFADSLTYRLKQIDTDGTTAFSQEVVVQRGLGTTVQFAALFPNPVRQQATIRYIVPEGSVQPVRLDIYNVLGQRVATLVDGPQSPGRKERMLNVEHLASGVYFLRLHVGDAARSRRVTVVR